MAGVYRRFIIVRREKNEWDSTDNAVGEAKQREKEAKEDATKKTTLKEDESIDTDEVSS